jgi:hypothetical protein
VPVAKVVQLSLVPDARYAQVHAVGEPDEVSVKVTESVGEPTPITGVAVKAAVPEDTVMYPVLVIVLLPTVLVAVRVTV